jgi:glutaminase
MECTPLLQKIYAQVKDMHDPGQLANYIPELANVSPDRLGCHLINLNKENFHIGDSNQRFSIQSIAKVLSLTLAYKLEGESLWSRVGVEPSGNPFNSLLQLESDMGIPRNPFINAGAMVVSDILVSRLDNPKVDFLRFVRKLSNNRSLGYSDKVAESEKLVGFRNVALCNFIKSFGNIKNDPDVVLDFYFSLCSLEMSCKEVSETFFYLSNDGFSPYGQEQVVTKSQCKRINALMQTCGFYDESGEFAFKIGIPGKSGVGGGIFAVHPNKYTMTVWSPRLNEKGNSVKGLKFLEIFTTETESSIF